MRRILALMLPAAVLAADLPAQNGTGAPGGLRVEGVGEPVAVGPATQRGYVAYPAWTLRAVGADVEYTPTGGIVVFEADTLEFDTGSPFFRAGGKSWQLVAPPYREGGIFYLPHQLFAEWLPGRYPDAVQYGSGRLRLRGPDRGGSNGAPQGPLGREVAELPAMVVIDAGHGGPDPGAVGPSGLREKDVVLQVSKRLAKVLADRGYEIRMTRTTDTLIALDDRGHMANEWRGGRPGLFLSIHANKVSDRRVSGYETFFLSDARTEDERRVAEMENAAVQYETGSRVEGSDDLDFILNSLRNDYYIRASHALAGLVQDEFGEFHRGSNRGVKQAGFRVLVRSFMPSVLVELAFISNPREERLLGSGAFQVQVAEAIADAVDRFFASQGDLWSGATR